MKCQTCGHRVVRFMGYPYHKGIRDPRATLWFKWLTQSPDFCLHGNCHCEDAVLRGESI